MAHGGRSVRGYSYGMELLFRLAAAALVLSGGAAWANPPKAKDSKKQMESLRQSSDLPADFESLADGSLKARGGSAVLPTVAGAGPSKRQPGLSPARPAQKLDLDSRIPAPWAAAARKARQERRHEIPWLELGAVLTPLCALMLLRASRSPQLSAEPAPVSAQRPSLQKQPPPRPRSPVARTEAAPEAPAAFVDTRMPVGTWRAISLGEQRLIEAWDRSPEKARGQASLEEWLTSKGGAPGVDIERLKAKLRRDA